MLASSPLQRLCVVLVSTRNPLNMGAAARAMSNFGCPNLRVVQPYEAAFRQARSAVGAEELLANAEEYATVAEAVADCTLVIGSTAVRERELRHPLFSLKDAAPLILEKLADREDRRGKTAVLFGSEKHGLSNQSISHCHWLLHIPTGEKQPSFNLGQAVAICLYELSRESHTEPAFQAQHASATGEDLERMTTVLLQALQASGYLSGHNPQDKEETLRRLIRRMVLDAADTAVWMGMLRQIVWKLRSKP
ncbi:MAG: RNA methyltransferase [Acidobacteriaceae bacterium]